MGRAFAAVRRYRPHLRVGVVGIGLGSVAAYGIEGDNFRFYEISPMIADLSRGSAPVFDMIRACPAQVSIQIGDGRLLLERELASGSQAFDLLLLDAFSGGQVPWHLLTRESFQIYLAHLAPGGVLVVHVSNRLPIDREVAAQAKDMGLLAMEITHPSPENPVPLAALGRSSSYVLLSRDTAILDPDLVRVSSWIILPPGLPLSVGPRSLPKVRRGELIAGSVQAWKDSRNSLASLLWAGRPAFLESTSPR